MTAHECVLDPSLPDRILYLPLARWSRRGIVDVESHEALFQLRCNIESCCTPRSKKITFNLIHIFTYAHIMTRQHLSLDQMQPIFESAAELFGLLASPQRLRILRVLCHGERSVGDIVDETGASQSNVSQHLAMLYRHRVVARRREGSQIYYRASNDMALELCRIVCTQFAIGQIGAAIHAPSAPEMRTR